MYTFNVVFDIPAIGSDEYDIALFHEGYLCIKFLFCRNQENAFVAGDHVMGKILECVLLPEAGTKSINPFGII